MVSFLPNFRPTIRQHVLILRILISVLFGFNLLTYVSGHSACGVSYYPNDFEESALGDTTFLEAAICSGTSFSFSGLILFTSGDYSVTLQAEDGSDSVIVLSLSVVPYFIKPFTELRCAGDTVFFSGDTLTQSGIYTDTLTASGGCDSVIVLTLSFVSFFQTPFTETICYGDTAWMNQVAYTASGIFRDTLSARGGCDSILILNLTVLPPAVDYIYDSLCAGHIYEFNGQIIDDGGVYTASFTSVNGCDSTAILILDILPASYGILDIQICSGETYLFNDSLLTESGFYYQIFPGANGCDSFAYVSLTILPQIQLNLNAVLCPGESFLFNGEQLTQTGTYSTVIPGIGIECDTIVFLHLTAGNNGESFLKADICSGETYDFNDQELTQSGIYRDTVSNDSGCYNFITLNLTVHQPSHLFLYDTICSGDTIYYNNQIITQQGIYNFSYPSFFGCDSLITLTVTEILVNNGITLSDGVLKASAINADYDWYNCTTAKYIQGAHNRTFIPAAVGNYAVDVTQFGCTDRSVCLAVLVLDTEENLEETTTWHLFPNPTDGQIFLTGPNVADAKISVWGTTGKMVRELDWNPISGQSMELDFTDLEAGTYYLAVQSSAGKQAFIIIKL